MTTLAKPKSVNNMESARPGMVGSVGDALIWGQLAKSTPDSPINWDPTFYGRTLNGSLTTPQPYVYDSAWNMGRHEQTAYGIMQQDIRAPDRLHEPTLAGVPQYQWRNKIATVYEAKRTGQKFLPVPGEYVLARGEMARGGQVVRTTDIEGMYRAVENQEPSPSVGLARYNNSLFRKNVVNGRDVFQRKTDMVVEPPLASSSKNEAAPKSFFSRIF